MQSKFEKELLNILKEKLFIKVENISKDPNIPFGPVDTIKVSVFFGDELIDHSSCVIQNKIN